MNPRNAVLAEKHVLGEAPLAIYTYEKALNDAAGSASVPIYLASHGLSGAIALEDEVGLPDWRTLATSLRLVRYDAYGHGQSGGCESPERYDWARQADDMASVLDWVNQRYPASGSGADVVLGGCSMSTGVALHLMSQIANGDRARPQWFRRIKALVLTLPPAGWAERIAIAEQYQRLSDVLINDGMARYLRLMALKPQIEYIVAGRPTYPEIYRQHIKTIMPERLAALLKGAVKVDYPAAEAMRKIDIPVLLLARQDDALHPVSCAEKLLPVLPQSVLFSAQSCEDICSWPARVHELAFAASAVDALADISKP